MANTKQILIAGAGPSGLSSAIFLSELGYKPRIIDQKEFIDVRSKALAVNARTLKLFKPLGITKRFLDNGQKVLAMNIWRNEKVVFRNDFTRLKGSQPFMLIQSQRESEEILLDEVRKRGIEVEYSSLLTSVEKTSQEYKSIINNTDFKSDYVIAADGAHSVIRKQSGIDFSPMWDNGIWELYDVELDLPLPKNEVHIRLFDEGGLIMIPMKNNVWRLTGSVKNLLNYLPPHTIIGNISWQTTFHISHHLARSLTKDNIVLIGDAAHLHSPVGGRGMNLGVEDAYITSQLIHTDKLIDYNDLRKPYLNRIIKRIGFLTQVMTGTTNFPRFVRNNITLAKPFFPIVRSNITHFILGQDK